MIQPIVFRYGGIKSGINEKTKKNFLNGRAVLLIRNARGKPAAKEPRVVPIPMIRLFASKIIWRLSGNKTETDGDKANAS